MGHAKAAIFCAAFAAHTSAQTLTGYHIGNSLTWNSRPERQPAHALTQGTDLTTGYHINCNRSLDEIVANPSETCVETVPEFGYFQEALTENQLDYITFQPFWTETSTLATDLQVIGYLEQLLDFNPDNSDTIMYLYQPWGEVWYMNTDTWSEPIKLTPDTPTTPANEYFEGLYQIISTDLDHPVRLIPVAQVLMEIRRLIIADEMPGLLTLRRFYQDDIHLTTHLGQFTASITAVSVITNSPPFGLHRDWIDEYGSGGYTTETYLAIENAVWDVISSDPRTGVSPCLADVNRDGVLSPHDFTAWIEAYNNKTTNGDQNRDGRVSPRDYSAWIANFNDGC